MWTYSTNIMGPSGLSWFEKNKIPYKTVILNNIFTEFKDVEHKIYDECYGGRIDCYCDNKNDPDYSHYRQELSLPIMDGESFDKFFNWLENQRTESLVTSNFLFNKFEEETSFKLVFCS